QAVYTASSPATAIISNISSSAVTPSNITIPSGYIQVNLGNSAAPDCSISTSIPAGTSCTLALEFSPIAPGADNANATVMAGNTVTIPLTGTGTGTAGSIPSSVTLGGSPSRRPYAAGSPVTFTAGISPSGATGTVSFVDSVSGNLGYAAIQPGG